MEFLKQDFLACTCMHACSKGANTRNEKYVLSTRAFTFFIKERQKEREKEQVSQMNH